MRFTQEKFIPVPKHLLKFRDEISPYGNGKEFKKCLGGRILLDTKKAKSALSRGHTMVMKSEDDEMVKLINVERNFVRELIKSPMKIKSKSPVLRHKAKIISIGKGKNAKNKFESLTACDFFTHGHKKARNDSKKSKVSVTPELSSSKKK